MGKVARNCRRDMSASTCHYRSKYSTVPGADDSCFTCFSRDVKFGLKSTAPSLKDLRLAADTGSVPNIEARREVRYAEQSEEKEK